MEKTLLGNLFEITDLVFFFWVWEGGRREGGGEGGTFRAIRWQLL